MIGCCGLFILPSPFFFSNHIGKQHRLALLPSWKLHLNLGVVNVIWLTGRRHSCLFSHISITHLLTSFLKFLWPLYNLGLQKASSCQGGICQALRMYMCVYNCSLFPLRGAVWSQSPGTVGSSESAGRSRPRNSVYSVQCEKHQGTRNTATPEEKNTMYFERVLMCWIYFYFVFHQLLVQTEILKSWVYTENVCAFHFFSEGPLYQQ